MSEDGTPPPEKKDLTGILELPQTDPVQADGSPIEADPFAVNELQPIETIDSFESLDQIGMMDHEPAPEIPSEPVFEDPFANTFTSEPAPETELQETIAPAIESFDASPPMDFLSEATAVKPVLEEIRSYSERAKETAFDPGTRNPFQLVISGQFDVFARDKLLLFITENPIGLSSSDLDFQINAGKVLLPRISEFSGVKLIQDLRDAGLSFQLKPSARDSDEPLPEADSIRYQFKEESKAVIGEGSIPILPLNAVEKSQYQVMDSIQMVQYLRAEILEVEKSDLFQDLLDRMTEALKRRARLKGAHALTSLQHKITPLRLPSQYQLELTASLLKKL